MLILGRVEDEAHASGKGCYTPSCYTRSQNETVTVDVSIYRPYFIISWKNLSAVGLVGRR